MKSIRTEGISSYGTAAVKIASRLVETLRTLDALSDKPPQHCITDSLHSLQRFHEVEQRSVPHCRYYVVVYYDSGVA